MSEEELSQVASSFTAEMSRGKKFIAIGVKRESVPEVCKRVAALPGLYHLTTITGVDVGQEIELLYQFWKEKRFVVVKTRVPKSDAHLPTVSNILPASVLYEAEIKDLLGVQFDGNRLMGTKLLLPDVYPADAPPPLTKEADPEKIRKMMELE
jgi:NADH:ubiquinone oxidoreductase subunit C